ncbi:MAG: hypothetical protein ACFFDN_44555 [Candidatus Hodarchaeota archaeon]
MTRIIPKNAPLRSAVSSYSLCKTCKFLIETNCKKKYQIDFKKIDGVIRVVNCTGYKEQIDSE